MDGVLGVEAGPAWRGAAKLAIQSWIVICCITLVRTCVHSQTRYMLPCAPWRDQGDDVLQLDQPRSPRLLLLSLGPLHLQLMSQVEWYRAVYLVCRCRCLSPGRRYVK
jgi:hypothetical protein